MNLFTINQATQAYVVTSKTEGTPGYAELKSTPDKKSIYVTVVNKLGNTVRTDLVDVDKVMCVTLAKAEDMAYKLKKVTIKVADTALDNGNLIAGQDYILRIVFDGYIGVSPEDSQYWKYGVVHATKGMSAATFYTKMAESIKQNMLREAVKLIDVTASADGIVISEVEQDWILGTKQQKRLKFSVVAVPITIVEGNTNTDIPWAEDKSINPDNPTIVYSDGDTITNGKLMADFEYFHVGNRGDQYRLVNFPDYVPTAYMVDPTKTYDVITTHYYYVGSNESCQKSEKDIVIITDPTLTDTIVSSLGEYNIEVVHKGKVYSGE